MNEAPAEPAEDAAMLAGMADLIAAMKHRRPSSDPASIRTTSTFFASSSGEEDGVVGRVERARVFEALFPRAAEPRSLGRYTVLDVLGQGGMGVVLRAYDRELDRPVALKVLHQGLAERHAQRLRREAQAMARLSHPNVVQVYEVAEVEGQTFVAMELVRGRTLQRWMQERPRPSWRACVQVFVQVGAGLAAAHERGLVHRDFKPGNAIIDEKGRPRVLDFGLVRQDGEVDDEPSTVPRACTGAHEAVPLETSLTDTGTVLGTPAYMPPEQMEARQVDARSDQFSFCVSLYEIHPRGSQPRDTTRLLAETLGILRGCPLVPS